MASRSWNRVELIGNLTRDPELRYTPNGAAVCTFGMATNRTYISDGEKKEEADFHRLVSWNKLAELCNQLLKKGNRVFVSGRLQTRQWEGQDGTQRNVTEIVIEDMILLTPKTTGEYTQTEEVPPPTEKAIEDVTVEEPKKEEEEKPQEKVEKTKTVEEDSEKEQEKAEKAKPAEKSPSEDIGPDEDLPF